jgi:hypothetical protein
VLNKKKDDDPCTYVSRGCPDDIDDKTESEKSISTIESYEDDNKNIFSLENCKNIKLDDDLFITINRHDNIVTYILSSETHELQKFINSCTIFYKNDISIFKHKNTIKISGFVRQCYYQYNNNKYLNVNYSKTFYAMMFILDKYNLMTNFKLMDDDDGKTLKVINVTENIIYNDVAINIVSNEKITSESTYIHTTFILKSNDVDLNKFVDECVGEFDAHNDEEKRNNKIIYYFKYLGKVNGELKFTKSKLSSKNKPLHETFNSIHNEHIDVIKTDIDRLKKLEYYKKTGMRRKKSYLFHGEPGCGKNATITAMALYDDRHIIDIDFNVLQYNSEFYQLMNLSKIEGVEFDKNEIIIMFDEIDIGMAKVTGNNLQHQNNASDEIIKQDNMIDLLADKIKSSSSLNSNIIKPIGTSSFDTLNLSNILSALDGICNYDGIIFTGLTNNLDNLPLPLTRALRLTPIYFTFLRQCDAISLIDAHFDIKLSQEQIDLIPDRKISPAKLKYLCELHSNESVDIILNVISSHI